MLHELIGVPRLPVTFLCVSRVVKRHHLLRPERADIRKLFAEDLRSIAHKVPQLLVPPCRGNHWTCVPEMVQAVDDVIGVFRLVAILKCEALHQNEIGDTNVPFGVLVDAGTTPGKATVAIAAGGLAGTVRVKLLQPVTVIGINLAMVESAGGCGFGPEPASGERILMAQALETGAIGELIEAVLFKPIYIPA